MHTKTTRQLVQAIQTHDPKSAININMLQRLFDSNALRNWKHGKRTVGDIDVLAHDLNKYFGFQQDGGIPRIRSIHNAFLELREIDPDLGVSEERIRDLVGMDKLPHISIGNRAYVALESFFEPYNDCLMYNGYCDEQKEFIKKVAEQQLSEGLERRNRKNAKNKKR